MMMEVVCSGICVQEGVSQVFNCACINRSPDRELMHCGNCRLFRSSERLSSQNPDDDVCTHSDLQMWMNKGMQSVQLTQALQRGNKEQLRQRGQDGGKDTDTLVQETDSQYGTWDTGLHTDDSLTPVTPSSDSNLVPSPRKRSLPQTPEEQKEPLNFPQSSTTLLDSSAQRSKAQLSKSCRRRRAPPSRTARHSSVLIDGIELGTDEWRFKDTTEDKPDSAKQQDDESDEEEPTRDSRTSTSSQPQRVSLFPGVDPSALMAQLKKRGETDSQTDGSSPSQLSRSPKSPFLGRASRVLPPVGGKENGEESSPQWLKELKTKKRFSQIENDG
ncbi:stress response protein NST1 isoform X1 [Tachysurus ichikawai]